MTKRFNLPLILIFLANLIQAQTVNRSLDICLANYCDRDTISKEELKKSHKIIPTTSDLKIFQFTYHLQCIGGDGFTKTVQSDSLTAFDVSLVDGVNHDILFSKILAKNKYGQIIILNTRYYYIRQ